MSVSGTKTKDPIEHVAYRLARQRMTAALMPNQLAAARDYGKGLMEGLAISDAINLETYDRMCRSIDLLYVDMYSEMRGRLAVARGVAA